MADGLESAVRRRVASRSLSQSGENLEPLYKRSRVSSCEWTDSMAKLELHFREIYNNLDTLMAAGDATTNDGRLAQLLYHAQTKSKELIKILAVSSCGSLKR